MSPSEKQNLLTEVSVRYAPDPNKEWFVLRVPYSRINQANAFLQKNNIDTYLPTHFIWDLINGKKKRKLEPLLPNLIFAYTSLETLDSCMKTTPARSYISYYYNHFKTMPCGNNPPLTITYQEMINFIRLTSVDNEHTCMVTTKQCHYKDGDWVQIVKGDFKGIVGKVARVTGQQRVVVKLDGVCLVATAYIPSSFIKKISDKNNKSFKSVYY